MAQAMPNVHPSVRAGAGDAVRRPASGIGRDPVRARQRRGRRLLSGMAVAAVEFSPGLFCDRVAAGASVALVMPSCDAAAAAALTDALTADERRRAARFRFVEDRCSYVTAHAALACLVRALLGAETGWRIVAGVNGKPEVQVADGPQLHVSLSHTRGLVAVAFSRVAPLGVDVEGRRAVAEDAALMRRVLSPAERAACGSSDAAFLTFWCRKEAWLKALGLGIAVDLDHYCVLDPRAPKGPGADGGLTLVDLPAPDGFAAALCVLAADQEVLALACGAARLPR